MYVYIFKYLPAYNSLLFSLSSKSKCESHEWIIKRIIILYIYIYIISSLLNEKKGGPLDISGDKTSIRIIPSWSIRFSSSPRGTSFSLSD